MLGTALAACEDSPDGTASGSLTMNGIPTDEDTAAATGEGTSTGGGDATEGVSESGPVPGSEGTESGGSSGGGPDATGEGSTGPGVPPPETACPHGVNGLGWGGATTHGCARTSDGRAACWQTAVGVATYLTFDDATELTSGVRQAVAGNSHGCVLLDTGAVHCWGNTNAIGIPGGQGTQQYILSAVPTIAAGATMLAAGTQHTCAIVNEADVGRVACWGSDGQGELGDVEANQQGVRDAVILPTDIPVSLGAGERHTCAAMADGSLKCWGVDQSGQVGTGIAGATRTPVETPTLVTFARPIVGVAGGNQHTCILDDNQAAYCWGSNTVGESGLAGGGTGFTVGPPNFPLLRDVVQVSAGGQQSLFLQADGTLFAIGIGGTRTIEESVAAVSAGNTTSCFARADGTVGCFDIAQTVAGPTIEIAFADATPLLVGIPTCLPAGV